MSLTSFSSKFLICSFWFLSYKSRHWLSEPNISSTLEFSCWMSCSVEDVPFATSSWLRLSSVAPEKKKKFKNPGDKLFRGKLCWKLYLELRLDSVWFVESALCSQIQQIIDRGSQEKFSAIIQIKYWKQKLKLKKRLRMPDGGGKIGSHPDHRGNPIN